MRCAVRSFGVPGEWLYRCPVVCMRKLDQVAVADVFQRRDIMGRRPFYELTPSSVQRFTGLLAVRRILSEWRVAGHEFDEGIIYAYVPGLPMPDLLVNGIFTAIYAWPSALATRLASGQFGCASTTRSAVASSAVQRFKRHFGMSPPSGADDAVGPLILPDSPAEAPRLRAAALQSGCLCPAGFWLGPL